MAVIHHPHNNNSHPMVVVIPPQQQFNSYPPPGGQPGYPPPSIQFSGYPPGPNGGPSYEEPPPPYSPVNGGNTRQHMNNPVNLPPPPPPPSNPYGAPLQPSSMNPYGQPPPTGQYSNSVPPSAAPGGYQNGARPPNTFNPMVSQCSGRRKALLIGINYFGTSAELRGCINDVRNIQKFLSEQYGYRSEDTVVLTDDQKDPKFQPTRANITNGMHWLVNGAQPNDSYFLHFSGHGGQTKDLDGDELDGTDETILPVDYKRAGQIVDDEINAILVRRLPPGVRLTAVFDSCHSGTAMDLPYVYSSQGKLKEMNPMALAGQSLQRAMLDPFAAVSMLGNVLGGKNKAKQNQQTKSSVADVIMFSGCKDSQYSADTSQAGFGNTGAMSYAFITALTRSKNMTYLQLLQALRQIMIEKGYKQQPSMSSGRPIDINAIFIM
ncbi:Ca(2+)-dependent cysteine protease [Basidiobolus ranarum]|uniref:Ca(2+)-dependent cysteine protease n=1 Tax=Basidiobolus ranarum TaxID=34480 RepID=A0ABR2W6K5_9FUNG